ncbi:MAG: hypothetical protein HY321_16210 [Armatimonadetes bacterium]|nr:hypothetical protein [Armatimonadota bacterium]
MRYRPGVALSLFLLLPSVLTGTSGLAQGVPDEPEVILLRADPDTIPADGQSTATITAEVRTRSDARVADGTLVHFTATAGIMNTEPVLTRGGIARASLRSVATEAIAEVTATAGTRAIQRIRVVFAAPGSVAERAKPFLRLEAHGVQFVPQRRLADAAGDANLSYRGLSIRADLLQLDVATLRVKARNNVRVSSGSKEITADLLSVDLKEMWGVLVAVEPGGIKRRHFRDFTLAAEEDPTQRDTSIYDFEEIRDPKTLMTARKITLFPDEKIQFSGFTYYVGGVRLLTLPHHVVALSPFSQEVEPYLGLDSLGGVSVSLPFYYSMTDSTNGSLRLRRQSRYSYGGYSARPGWHLALQQRYNLLSGTRGVVELNHITTGDWGLRWQHDQPLARQSHAYLGVDSPSHRDFYTRAEVYHPTGIGDFNLSLYGTFLPHAPSSLQSRLYLRSRPGTIRPLKLRYYWSTNFGWSYWNGASETEEGADLQVHAPAWRLSRSASVQVYAGSGYTLSAYGSGPTAQASAALLKRFGRTGNASLRYSYYASGRGSSVFGPSSSQAISGYVAAGMPNSRWDGSATATLYPSTGTLSVYAGLRYSPLANWRLGVSPTYSRYGGTVGRRSAVNLDVYLLRRIGGRDVGLRWSTLDRRFRFEMATTAFHF